MSHSDLDALHGTYRRALDAFLSEDQKRNALGNTLRRLAENITPNSATAAEKGFSLTDDLRRKIANSTDVQSVLEQLDRREAAMQTALQAWCALPKEEQGRATALPLSIPYALRKS